MDNECTITIKEFIKSDESAKEKSKQKAKVTRPYKKIDNEIRMKLLNMVNLLLNLG